MNATPLAIVAAARPALDFPPSGVRRCGSADQRMRHVLPGRVESHPVENGMARSA